MTKRESLRHEISSFEPRERRQLGLDYVLELLNWLNRIDKSLISLSIYEKLDSLLFRDEIDFFEAH